MRDELPDWLDATTDEPAVTTAGRRRDRLRFAALVPWAVVVGLLVVGRFGTIGGDTPDPHVAADHDAIASQAPDPDAPDPDAPDPDAPDPDAPDPDAPDPDGGSATPDTPVATEFRGQWRMGPDDGDAAALAVAVARAWLTGIDPRSAIHGIAPVSDHTYVEHIAVEAVERTGTDTAVVSLLAVILERDGDQAEVRTGRLSVPIAFVDGEVRPAGTPWWAPTPDLRPAVPSTDPVNDADVHLAAVDALLHAGFTDVELRALGQTDSGPWIATLSGRSPDGSPIDGEVWLRPHLDGFVVAGATLHQPTTSDRREAGT